MTLTNPHFGKHTDQNECIGVLYFKAIIFHACENIVDFIDILVAEVPLDVTTQLFGVGKEGRKTQMV